MMEAITRGRLVSRAVLRTLLPGPDRFLRAIDGLIHVGANVGQEARQYERLGLRVLWVEPMPDVFRTLEANVAPYLRQRALQALVTDKDDELYEFHVASNNGASSSILSLGLHKDVWPEVAFERTLRLKSTTLSSLLVQANIDVSLYQALVLDTQGSELLVLRGAAKLLDRFRFVKAEVPDFEAYVGCCHVVDVQDYLRDFGFEEVARRAFARHPAGGCYYDILYGR